MAHFNTDYAEIFTPFKKGHGNMLEVRVNMSALCILRQLFKQDSLDLAVFLSAIHLFSVRASSFLLFSFRSIVAICMNLRFICDYR